MKRVPFPETEQLNPLPVVEESFLLSDAVYPPLIMEDQIDTGDSPEPEHVPVLNPST